jgi:hypothetical protein
MDNPMCKLFYSLLLAPLLALGSQQVINVGSSPNDHTGDTVRAAFIKDNANVAELFQHATTFNVLTYGALNNGTNLSATTTAIQAAYTAACAAVHGNASGGIVEYPPGEYRSGPVIQTCGQVWSVATGKGAVKITFVPTGNTTPTALAAGVADPGTWLTIANSTFTGGQPTIAFYGGIKGFRISTDDLTTQKNAIYLAETSQFTLQELAIDKFWGNNSAGIRIAGHEVTHVSDSYVSATVPIWINKALVSYGGTKYNDTYTFSNIYTRAPHSTDPATYYPSGISGGVPNTNYLIDDGVFASNWVFEQLNWVGGANAIYWKATTTSNSTSYKVAIRDGRKEQSGGTNALADPIIGLVFDFTGAPTPLNDLTVDDVYISGTHTDSGIYAHHVNNMILNSFRNSGYTADGLFVMDVDNVFSLKVINLDAATAGNPSTINIGANIGTLRNASFRQNCNTPNNGEWLFESSPRVTKTMAAGTTSNWTTVFGVSSDIGGLDFPRGVTDVYVTTTAGAATSTGLPPPDSTTGLFSHGGRIRWHNANGGNKFTFVHNSSSETTASHRYECALATDADVLPGQWRLIQYDFTLSRWVVE